MGVTLRDVTDDVAAAACDSATAATWEIRDKILPKVRQPAAKLLV